MYVCTIMYLKENSAYRFGFQMFERDQEVFYAVSIISCNIKDKKPNIQNQHLGFGFLLTNRTFKVILILKSPIQPEYKCINKLIISNCLPVSTQQVRKNAKPSAALAIIALGPSVLEKCVLNIYTMCPCTKSGIPMKKDIQKISFTMAVQFVKNSTSFSSHFSPFKLNLVQTPYREVTLTFNEEG